MSFVGIVPGKMERFPTDVIHCVRGVIAIRHWVASWMRMRTILMKLKIYKVYDS